MQNSRKDTVVMQNISLQIFQKIYEKFKPNVFIFASEKQNTYRCADFNIKFSDVKFIVNQNLMYLCNGESYLTITHINCIFLEYVKEEDSFIVTVSCADFSCPGDADSYTFVMRKSILYN